MKRGEVSAFAQRDDVQAINTDEMILIMRDERYGKDELFSSLPVAGLATAVHDGHDE